MAAARSRNVSRDQLYRAHVYFELLATWVGSSEMGFFSVGGDLYDKCPKFKLALNIIGLLISATGLALGFYFDIYSTPMVIMLVLDMAMTGLGFIDALFTIGATLCCVIFCCKCREETENGRRA